MTKTWFVNGKRYSNTNNITQYGKLILKLKKLLKLYKENVIFVLVIKVKFISK